MKTQNNRRLLKLAAKAGEYDHFEYVENEYRDGRKVTGHYDPLLEVCINPLTDIADATRLSIKVGFSVIQNKASGVCSVYRGDVFYSAVPYKDDPVAATCRAIVCAAARLTLQRATSGPASKRVEFKPTGEL